MDFLERLRYFMDRSEDTDASLAKKSGIPYTTINGLFKRGWEKAQISTIQKICQHYNVSLDYMIYGSAGLSEDSQMIAAKFDGLDEDGKELVSVVIDLQTKRMKKIAPEG